MTNSGAIYIPHSHYQKILRLVSEAIEDCEVDCGYRAAESLRTVLNDLAVSAVRPTRIREEAIIKV
ncbi:MAG: hypothetical protein H6905_08785 [Hyphomicrobiales bacterium]|nr:hypothetical protein [Hyphomicrobiales bacterium]